MSEHIDMNKIINKKYLVSKNKSRLNKISDLAEKNHVIDEKDIVLTIFGFSESF